MNKIVEINDNGIAIRCNINKLNVFTAISLFVDIAQLIASTDNFKADSIMQYFYGQAKLGIVNENIDTDEVKKIHEAVVNKDTSFWWDLIRGMVLNLSEDKQRTIIAKALQCVSVHNGVAGDIKLINDKIISETIIDPVNIILLIKEVILLNYKQVIDNVF